MLVADLLLRGGEAEVAEELLRPRHGEAPWFGAVWEVERRGPMAWRRWEVATGRGGGIREREVAGERELWGRCRCPGDLEEGRAVLEFTGRNGGPCCIGIFG